MPGLAALVEWGGWQPVVLTVAACCAALIPLVYFLVPDRPASVGLRSFGSQHDDHPAPPAEGNPFIAAFLNLARAAKTRAFWFLFATFFICGFTTNGLVGTHLIAFCGDHGIVEVQAASLLALMGFFDLFGTTFSGWLTDRFDPRKLVPGEVSSPLVALRGFVAALAAGAHAPLLPESSGRRNGRARRPPS